MATNKRIMKEHAEIQSNEELKSLGVTIAPEEGNLLKWEGVIEGPAPYYTGGKFAISAIFPIDYPFKAVSVSFRTKIYHPNVTDEGLICLGLLKSEAWKPSTKLVDVLRALVQLLAEPNPDDPLVAEIAEKYTKDREGFKKEAQAHVQKYGKKAEHNTAKTK